MTSRAAGLAAALLLTASGCVSASAEMGTIRREVARDLDGRAEVGDGTSVSLGRVSLATARTLGGVFSPGSTRAARRLSRSVRRVQFAAYPVRGLVDPLTVARPSVLARYASDGWHPLAAFRDSTAATWVMTRERARDQTVSDVLTVSLSRSELSVARLSGDLTALALDAVSMARTGPVGDVLRAAGVGDGPEPGEPASGLVTGGRGRP